MKIVQLQADNFKRLVAVEIAPDGNVVEVTGKNGSGKSSVLDAIYVALVGRSAAPPKPIREGEEKCHIKLDLGDIVVTRTFTKKDGSTYTDTLKVENADGLRYGQPQQVLDALLGEIGFDPFEFCQMKAAAQAEALLQMVPLPVDLDELAELDQSDYQKRRDINRDLAADQARLAAIPKEEVPGEAPDRNKLVEQLGRAADTNTAILRDRNEREQQDGYRISYERQITNLEAELASKRESLAALMETIEKREPLPELVDTDALREQLVNADRALALIERQQNRDVLAARVEQLEGQSEALTKAMEEREQQRRDALAKAKMPIDGLGFQIDEKGKPLVSFGGVPFEQASTAEQLRASTAIAMAANPSLRVLRVKDGSLLDDDSMKLLAEMAKAEDFQLWIERVGTGGVGIVMENGAVKAAPAKKAAAKATETKEGQLV